ncbi:zinc-dependent metalloprotease [Rhizohabitans arisaemae]|uniref:zinc-dependent metalloprotease n=1 Tax=Rhizohabitans arisaemae TaxID=2720610 RepID=UPI0024B2787B|nr:zinc-dependent metalloprotease [Rhizohabitans arisaemae]
MQVIDWDVAVATGVRLVRPGPQVSRAEARAAVLELRKLSREAEVHVKEFTKLDGDSPPHPATVVDRIGWIRANVDGFRVVLEPITDRLASKRATPAIVGAVGSRITGVEVGAVLAFLASRVLGQYELFLPPDPSGQTPAGRLTLVAPNIVNAERELGVNPRDFRLWVCLHEETHRVQFTAVPWLREYVRAQMTEFLLASDIDLSTLLERLRSAADVLADAVRGQGDANLIDVIQSPEQREILDRLTAVMTLVEGHGDYVMDAVGPSVVPTVEEIRARFQKRREGASRMDRTIRRLLGLEMKMKQYAEGSAFVTSVVEQVGIEGFNRVWTSPETLPTHAEIAQPRLWINRVLSNGALSDGASEPSDGGSESSDSGSADTSP